MPLVPIARPVNATASGSEAAIIAPKANSSTMSATTTPTISAWPLTSSAFSGTGPPNSTW